MEETKKTDEQKVKAQDKGSWTPHVSKVKEKKVEKIVKKLKDNPIVGAVNMEGMPAKQLQIMRSKLRESVDMMMAKRRIINIAIDQAASEKKGLEKIKEKLKGMPALMFTKENPFSIYKEIKKNKSPAPAKAGQTAPKDIVVPAGATPFAPGPIISELGGIGIKAGVENGKVAIKEDCVVVKEGETISEEVAGILTRLGIEPMEIGLDITGVYEDGVIYDRNILDIDEDEFMDKINNAARWAFNLAVEAGHFTAETMNVLVPKAFREAKAVALEGNIMADAVKEEILAKAEMQANSLKDSAKIETKTSAKKEEVKEEQEDKKDDDKEVKAEETKKEEAKELPENTQEKEQPVQKVEQDQKEESDTEEKKEHIKEESNAVKEEIKEIKEEIQEESKKDMPDAKNIDKIEEEIEEVSEEIKEIEKEKQEIKAKDEEAKERDKQQASDDSIKNSQNLFDELKKKGTLRDVEQKDDVPKGNLSPEDIIKKGVEDTKKKSAEYEASAQDLRKKNKS